MQGKVKWFSDERGFGFLVGEGGKEIFVHYSNIEGNGHRVLYEGDKVSFETELTEKGMKAVKVTILERQNEKSEQTPQERVE